MLPSSLPFIGCLTAIRSPERIFDAERFLDGVSKQIAAFHIFIRCAGLCHDTVPAPGAVDFREGTISDNLGDDADVGRFPISTGKDVRERLVRIEEGDRNAVRIDIFIGIEQPFACDRLVAALPPKNGTRR